MSCHECLAACWGPTVDGDLNQSFFDLIDRYATGNCGIRVNAYLQPPVVVERKLMRVTRPNSK
jgi:hypothetical protein